jgi:hypothetical protein
MQQTVPLKACGCIHLQVDQAFELCHVIRQGLHSNCAACAYSQQHATAAGATDTEGRRLPVPGAPKHPMACYMLLCLSYPLHLYL